MTLLKPSSRNYLKSKVCGDKMLSATESRFQDWRRNVDTLSIAAVIILFVIGLAIGFAASPVLAERLDKSSFHFVIRQITFAVPSFMVLFYLSFATLQRVRRFGLLLFLISFIIMLFLPTFGLELNGSTRWLRIPSVITFQPSEFMKPGLVIASAFLLAGAQQKEGIPGHILSFLLVICVVTVLIFQPDFGQAALVIAVWAVMFFVAGASIYWFVGLGGLAALAVYFGYSHLPSHVTKRLDAFLHPEQSDNYQVDIAESAIRNGGLWGRGPGEGVVIGHLPDAHTDFVLAVAAEEYGALVCLFIIGLFAFVALRGLWRVQSTRDPFIRIAAVGLAALFGLQVLVNVAVALQMLPAKGMTLPFISYGGSSLMAVCITIGMLLALTKTRKQHDYIEVWEQEK